MSKLIPISLNELPKYSPWVKRLLGLEKFNRVKRTSAKNYSEYDRDKFASLLTYSKRNPDASIENIRLMERRRASKDTVCVSRNGKLFLTTASNALRLEHKLFIDTVSSVIGSSDVVIDLGAGYGYNLLLLRNKFPELEYIGGDFSQNAVTLSRRLLKDIEAKVVPFNFYDREWDVFCLASDKKILVFTYHSIMQLPRAASVFRGLRKYKEHISDVIHLEPIYEMYEEADTLGLFRKKYTLLNDYNSDLLSVLKKAKSEVEIIDTKYDALGINPLLPTSIIHWRFKKHKRK